MVKKSIQITLWIMIITVFTKILGFARETSIAYYFGASAESDAFYVAYMIPSILFASVTQSIGTTFIPVYTRMEKQSRLYFTNNLINIIGIFTIFLSAISIIFTPYLVNIFAYGFSEETKELTVTLTRILLIIMLSLAFNAIARSRLQSHERFLIPASITIPFNIIIIGYLIIFGSSYGIIGFAWVVVIASFFQSIYLLPSLFKTGWRYKLIFDWKEEGLQKILRLSGPVIIGATVTQINIVIDRMLASGLSEGSISALNYANKVNQLSFGIIVISIVSVLYPKFSQYGKANRLDELKKLTLYGIKILIIILLPIIFGGIVLAQPIIQVLFERGAFDATDTAMTSIAFAFYSIGLLGIGIRELLNRTFYSLQDTKTPMRNGILALTLNIILNLILVRYLEHGGLALATSISLTVTSILLFRSLTKKIGKIADKDLYLTFIKSIISSLIMAIIVYKIYYMAPLNLESSLYQLIWLSFSIFIGIVVYFIASILLRQSLLIMFLKDIKAKINRR